jgi:hypothetical protein
MREGRPDSGTVGRGRELRRAAVAAGLALALAPAPAAGERLALRWTAPAGCPSATEVQAEVARLLGDRTGRTGRDLAVTAEVAEARPGEWSVRLAEGAHERVVRGASCPAVAAAAAVILALMIDPTAEVEPAPALPPASWPVAPASAPAPPPHPPAAPSPPVILPAPAPPATAWPRSWSAGAWASVDAGSLPGAAAGFGVGGALGLGRQQLTAAFEAWPSDAGSTAEKTAAGGRFDLLVGVLGTCRTLLTGRLELAPCVAVELGRLHARGYGVAAPGEGSSVWVAGRGGVRAGWRLTTRLNVVLRADAVVPFERPSFVLVNVGPVHRPAAVAGRAGLGLEARF